MTALPKITIASSWYEFDRMIEEAAVTVEFESVGAEREYEQADWRLHWKVCGALGVRDSPTRDDGLVHVVEDWFPTKTKFVEADFLAIGHRELLSLGALLVGEFADWRINVQFYRGLDSTPAEHIGGLNIHADRMLVQEEVAVVLRLRPDDA